MTAGMPRQPHVVVAAASADEARLITTWLGKDLGWEVVHSTLDGDDAIHRALKLQPELVVANVNLTGASGLEIAEQLWARAPAVGCVLIADANSWGANRRAMRAGALDFLHPPLGADGADALRTALGQVERRRALVMQRPAVGAAGATQAAIGSAISVMSAKGGVGRSLVAASISSWLSLRASTLLCDLDLQFGDVGTWGREGAPHRTVDQLAAVVAANELTQKDVEAVAEGRFGNVALLAAPSSGGDGALFPVGGLVNGLRQWYRWVVIDNMCGLSQLVLDTARAADLAIVVTTGDVGSLRATLRLIERLDSLAPTPRVVIANRIGRDARGLVEKAFGRSETVVMLGDDARYARDLVVDGLAAPQQSGRRLAKEIGGVAAWIESNVQVSG